jgi:hypothetical protein
VKVGAGNYAKDLVGECLADRFHGREIQIYLSEALESSNDPPSLGVGDEKVPAILSQAHRYSSLGKSVIIDVLVCLTNKHIYRITTAVGADRHLDDSAHDLLEIGTSVPLFLLLILD